MMTENTPNTESTPTKTAITRFAHEHGPIAVSETMFINDKLDDDGAPNDDLICNTAKHKHVAIYRPHADIWLGYSTPDRDPMHDGVVYHTVENTPMDVVSKWIDLNEHLLDKYDAPTIARDVTPREHVSHSDDIGNALRDELQFLYPDADWDASER